MAATPPRKNIVSTATRYMTPIFLWSMVVAHATTVLRNGPRGVR